MIEINTPFNNSVAIIIRFPENLSIIIPEKKPKINVGTYILVATIAVLTFEFVNSNTIQGNVSK